MKTALNALVLSLLVVSILPGVIATSVGGGITPDIETEDFPPLVWLCGDRVVYDDGTEPGRISDDGQPLVERINNYAFEGEQVSWIVLVMDKNGIDKVSDVYATVGDSQGQGNDIEANCQSIGFQGQEVFEQCNARIQEEEVEWNDDLMDFYECTLTVETPESMQGEYWVTVEAIDLDGLMGTMAENEWWFFNPIIALTIDGDLTFENVRPGSSSYSSTLLVGNDAEAGSGVMMDMFISGTDFYDSSSSGAACPDTNQLSLSAFRYFATSGAYSTLDDGRGIGDAEGYVPINYGTGFNDPNPFYGAFDGDFDGYEVIQGLQVGPYFPANTLAPGAEHAITFRLDLPEPCNGDFDSGSLFFWGEAI